MRWALGLIPFAAAAAVAWGLVELGPSARATADAETLLTRASERIVAAGSQAASYEADVEYGRQWSGANVTARFRVQVRPGRPIAVRFLGLDGLPEGSPVLAMAGGMKGFTVRVPGLESALKLVRDPALAARNYTFTALNEEPAAGRAAVRYELKPKFPGRRTLQLVIDREHQVPLERREFAADGTELGAWRVTAFQTPAGDPFPAAISLPAMLHEQGETDITPAAAQMQLYQPGWLPGGFAAADQRLVQTEAGPIVTLEYTDGVARLAVVQWPKGAPVFEARAKAAREAMPKELRERMKQWRGPLGSKHGTRRRHGKKGRHGRHHRWGARVTIGETEIRIFGELPKETLQQVAEQLQARPGVRP